jgi:hypothetical protein
MYNCSECWCSLYFPCFEEAIWLVQKIRLDRIDVSLMLNSNE